MNFRTLLLLLIIPMFCFGIRDVDTHNINNSTLFEANYARLGYKGFYRNSPTTILETEKDLPPTRPIITLQIYPNPIRNNSKISFSLAQSGMVTIKLYNAAGQIVKKIFDGHKPAGYYNMNLDTKGLAQGSYLLRIETPTKTLSRPFVIMR